MRRFGWGQPRKGNIGSSWSRMFAVWPSPLHYPLQVSFPMGSDILDRISSMPDRRPIEEIRRLPGGADATWVDPPKRTLFVGVSPAEELRPLNMLFVQGLYLVETANELGSWWMGQERADGVVTTWGRYGPLEQALKEL